MEKEERESWTQAECRKGVLTEGEDSACSTDSLISYTMNIFQRKAASVLRQTILNSHKHSSTFPVLHLSFYSTVSTRKQHPHHLHSSPCFHTHEPTRQYHQEEGSVAFVSSLHSSSCGQNNRHQSPRTTRSFSSAVFRNMSLTRHASPFISPTPATPSPHTFSVGVVLPAMAPTSTRFFHSSLKTQYNVPSHMNFNEGGGGGHQHSGGNSVWRRIRNWTLGLGGVYVFYLSLPYLMYIGGIGIAWYAGRSGFRFLRNEYNKVGRRVFQSWVHSHRSQHGVSHRVL